MVSDERNHERSESSSRSNVRNIMVGLVGSWDNLLFSRTRIQFGHFQRYVDAVMIQTTPTVAYILHGHTNGITLERGRIVVLLTSFSRLRSLTFFVSLLCSIYDFAKTGFYMAVNVGYSIGFGYPAENYLNYLYFSSCYVLVGSSFVAVALGFFADKISEDHDNWFTNLIQQKEYEEAFQKSSSMLSRFRAIFDQHAPTLRAVSIWLTTMGIMISYSMLEVGWSFTEAQYFAITCLSTGGLWRIPDDSATWMFGVTGVFAMMGVPIMAVAMAQVARGLTDKGDLEATKAAVNEPVTAEELIMLQKFGLESMTYSCWLI